MSRFVIHTNLAIKLGYLNPSRDTAEEYQRAHTQNILNRIAFRYFKQDKYLEDLKKHLSVELLLEGMSLPSSIKSG